MAPTRAFLAPLAAHWRAVADSGIAVTPCGTAAPGLLLSEKSAEDGAMLAGTPVGEQPFDCIPEELGSRFITHALAAHTAEKPHDAGNAMSQAKVVVAQRRVGGCLKSGGFGL